MPSLSACSLISRTWHIESRRIFFHKLSMNVNGTMYRDDPLPSTRTTFGTEALIREITFHSGRNFQHSDVEYWSASLFTIARILAHYPALETVRISTIRWTLRSDPPSSWDWTRPRPSVSLPTVKRVVLFYPYQIPTHSKLCTLLAWFPALEDLEIVKSPGPPQSIVKNITPSGLFFGITVERSLSRDAVVSHSPTRVLLDGFASRVARNLAVRTLVFDIETDKDVRSASLMLHKLRTKLQHLVFRLPASSTLRESQFSPFIFRYNQLNNRSFG